jgi:hypothetical protein
MNNCEKCRYPQALSEEDRAINIEAREAVSSGKDLPGAMNTMCGQCIAQEKIDSALNEDREEFLKGVKITNEPHNAIR